MSSAILVLILISLSFSAALTPTKSIVLIQNSDSAKCGPFILPATFLQRQALEICKVEVKYAKCLLSKCSLPRITNRPTYYKGNLFPNEKAPLIEKILQSDVYLRGQKISSSYIIVKWDMTSKICSRVGVLHKFLNGAPFVVCQSFDPKKSVLRVDLDEGRKRKSISDFLHEIPEDVPV
ncbi:hypothetical protein HI914_00517 [Erysiphe necator]|nr:hypothetical protein HI914_00517 [Erysiphe necator]